MRRDKSPKTTEDEDSDADSKEEDDNAGQQSDLVSEEGRENDDDDELEQLYDTVVGRIFSYDYQVKLLFLSKYQRSL